MMAGFIAMPPSGPMGSICLEAGTSRTLRSYEVRRCLMASHALTHEEARRGPARSRRRNGLLQLGWPHYWLLVGVLGGILSLVAMVFLMVRLTS